MALPFLEPDYDYNLNMAVLLIIITISGHAVKGNLILNNERLHLYLYLVSNPIILDRVIEYGGFKSIKISEENEFSITSIAPNFDVLCDKEALKILLSGLISQNLISVQYIDKKGFFYIATEKGQSFCQNVETGYFHDILIYSKNLKQFNSKGISQINNFVNKAIKANS